MSPSAPPSPSQALARLLRGGRAFPPLGLAVLAVVLVTVLVVALSVWPLLRVRQKAEQPIPEARSDEALYNAFRASVGGDLAQIEGRSLFAVPAPPAPVQAADKPDTAKATRYGGPSVVAMVNGKVWFSDGQRLGAGEAGAGSLKVVSLDAPWSAKVQWQGGEFDVEFFQRSPLLSGKPIAESAEEPSTYVPPALRRRPGARALRPTPGSAGSPPAAPAQAGARAQAPRNGSGADGHEHPSEPDEAPPPPPMQDPPSDEPVPQSEPVAPPTDPHPATPPNTEPGAEPHPEPSPSSPPSPEPEPENAHP